MYILKMRILVIKLAKLLFLPFILFPFILSLVFFFLLRTLIWSIGKILRPDLQCLVTGLDASFTLGKGAGLPMNLITVLGVQGSIGLDELRKDFQTNIFCSKGAEADSKKLKSYWINFLGYPFWKNEANFELEKHVRVYDYQGDCYLPEIPSTSDLERVLGKLLFLPWPREQSPWEILYLENYGEVGKSGYITRADHILGDAYSGMRLLRSLTKTDLKIPEFKISQRDPSAFASIGIMLKVPWDLLLAYLENTFVSKLAHTSDKIDGIPRFILGPEYPVELIKSIKNYYKVSYAEVLISTSLGAICRMCEQSKLEEIPKDINMAVIIPNPKQPEGMGNYAFVACPTLPLVSRSPRERLLKIHGLMETLGKSTEPLGRQLLIKLTGIYPTWWHDLWSKFGAEIFPDVYISMLPVTTTKEYYRELEMLEILMVAPICRNITGIGVAFGGIENNQQVSFTVQSNSLFSGDVARNLGSNFAQEIEQLQADMIQSGV